MSKEKQPLGLNKIVASMPEEENWLVKLSDIPLALREGYKKG